MNQGKPTVNPRPLAAPFISAAPRHFAAALAILIAALLALPATTHAAADDLPTLDDLLNLSGDEPKDDQPDEQSTGGDANAEAPDEQAADGQAEANGEDLELDQALLDQLAGGEAKEPLTQALKLMGNAASRLNQRMDPGVETQRIQKDVLAKLDQVIADAQKRRPKSSSSSSSSSSSQQQQQQDTGSQQNQAQQQQANGQQQGQQQQQGEGDQPSNDPSRESGNASGQGGAQQAQLDESQMLEYRQEWGNLPERLREDLMQGLGERYSSVYEELTRAYYRRLAQEQE